MKKVERFVKHHIFKKTLKQIEMNNIRNKISKNKSLTPREKYFLDLFQSTQQEEMCDFLYLSKNSTFSKILELLENKIKVICNLHDRNGRINLEIVKIENNFEDETCIVTMKHDEHHKLHDRFLYNLIYNKNKNEYSLEEQDEYFEKVETND